RLPGAVPFGARLRGGGLGGGVLGPGGGAGLPGGPGGVAQGGPRRRRVAVRPPAPRGQGPGATTGDGAPRRGAAPVDVQRRRARGGAVGVGAGRRVDLRAAAVPAAGALGAADTGEAAADRLSGQTL